MHFTRCTLADLNEAVVQANLKEGYDLVWSLTSGTGLDSRSFRGRIIPTSSYVKGARRAASGRRVRAACWHAHRDVLAALFEMVPDARVSTALATYHGRDDFEDKFPYTAEIQSRGAGNVESFADLCDCEE